MIYIGDRNSLPAARFQDEGAVELGSVCPCLPTVRFSGI